MIHLSGKMMVELIVTIKRVIADEAGVLSNSFGVYEI